MRRWREGARLLFLAFILTQANNERQTRAFVKGFLMRFLSRAEGALRPVEITPHVVKHAAGSCLIKMGETHVLCAASISEKVPSFVKGSGLGWITAEYGMLPCATHERTEREAVKGRQTGRTQEIQRLIGRSLRAAVDRRALGEIQIKIDCDVLQADGGTRTASITGGYVALAFACRFLQKTGRLSGSPLIGSVAAVSCGLCDGVALLDLDYTEDSTAQADANFVMTGAGALIEIQATAEQEPFSQENFLRLLSLARAGIAVLASAQERVLS